MHRGNYTFIKSNHFMYMDDIKIFAITGKFSDTNNMNVQHIEMEFDIKNVPC